MRGHRPRLSRRRLAVSADFLIIDTPGADTDLSRAAHRPPT